jgi:hypothetical protein
MSDSCNYLLEELPLAPCDTPPLEPELKPPLLLEPELKLLPPLLEPEL